MPDTPPRPRVRFGAFELDPVAGELLKRGTRLRLHDKPFQLLLILLERPGETVTRKELEERLWPGGTFVEFENGINNAVSRLRDALGDSADSPRFIETLPRRGYRFIAPIEVAAPDVPAGAVAEALATEVPVAALDGGTATPRRPRWWLVAGIAAAAALLAVFAASRARSPVAEASAIAVLPFVTGGAAEGSTDEYVAFGMTEALITELSRVGALKVISQTSVMQYKDARKGLPAIAGELGVGTVVEGSVLHEGDRVRITVQLIDARTDTHLWAQTYDREPSNALSSQRELSREVAGLIRARLVPSDRSTAPPPRPTVPAAYEAYVKGRYFLQKPDDASWGRARAFFEEAIAADPAFAPAHVGLATYFVLTDTLAAADAMPRAKASAERALALDASSAAAHATLAFVHYFGEWDWPASGRAFEQAIALDPSDATTHRWHALYLSSMGRHATAAEEIERAIELDPVSISAYDAAAAIWSNARRYDKVLEQARRIDDLSPGDPRGLMHVALATLHQGRFTEAVEAAQQGVTVSRRNPAFLCVLAVAQHRAGQKDEAQRTLVEIEQQAATGHVSDVFLAVAYLWLRDHDVAFVQLERAYERRDAYMVVANVAPWFDPLRDDPRFQDLLRRMHFPQ